MYEDPLLLEAASALRRTGAGAPPAALMGTRAALFHLLKAQSAPAAPAGRLFRREGAPDMARVGTDGRRDTAGTAGDRIAAEAPFHPHPSPASALMRDYLLEDTFDFRPALEPDRRLRSF